MSITNCPRCNALLIDGLNVYGKPHRCPPAWLVWLDDEGYTREDDAETIYAFDAKQAAEKFAAQFAAHWGDEYNLMDGAELSVIVSRPHNSDPGPGQWQYFTVTGYTKPVYTASARDHDRRPLS